MSILDVISSVLLVSGAFFGLSGAIGLFKFPDFFTRVHAASVTDSLAAMLMIGGLLLQTSFDINTAKLLFILIFLMMTTPTASHALAKSARHGGLLSLAENKEQQRGQDSHG
ncbi:sodium:proton antiporter [Saccharobesus litoralis]|uniref:Sodium:proton antiporter n=1 Tax=Saccharobesus litoralis TaxID=2172099 RepID=A0A2S0VQR5_9ALTE|nr:monovalent cation/H(+) antiporter subunit G [Saccharobesus litoralis]AWB66430.1 sodium:proton antiporter [Saccharobesus litoralis]